MFITVKAIDGENLGTYRWNEDKEIVEVEVFTENETFKKILEDAYESEEFFIEDTEEIVNDKCLDYWDGFVIKINYQLVKYGFIIEVE